MTAASGANAFADPRGAANRGCSRLLGGPCFHGALPSEYRGMALLPVRSVSENGWAVPHRFYGNFSAAADTGAGEASASAIVAQLVPAAEIH